MPDTNEATAATSGIRICGPGQKPAIKRSRSSRWRMWTLISVHILFMIHLSHWLTTGRTLSPVEPSESMFFIERGELNAGFIFFASTLLLTLIFGRFFCGWGCHVVALQDLCGAIMKKCGVRPQLFKSRLLMYVPLIIGFEMFIWPSIQIHLLGPPTGIISDLDWVAWFDGIPAANWVFSNHLMTTGFWDTFAGPWMAIPFLGICGFAVVYFLGAKGFCTYGCPYGAFFAGADRLAPGKIVANLDACEKCGHCTASCTSNVRIHEEIQVYEKVVSPGCMKCLDCVSVCPTGALSFGMTTPKLFSKPLEGRTPKAKRFDLTMREELVYFILFFAIRYAWRSVYHEVPMLMATGIAGCLTFLLWKSVRTFRDRDVRVLKYPLKSGGQILRRGHFVRLATASSMVLTVVLGISKWHQEQAEWQYARLSLRNANMDHVLLVGLPPVDDQARAIAARGAANLKLLRTVGNGGLALRPQPEELPIEQRLGYFWVIAGDLPAAQAAWEKDLPENQTGELATRYAQLIFRRSYDAFATGDLDGAIAIVSGGLTHLPNSPFLADKLSVLYAEKGDRTASDEWRKKANQLQAEVQKQSRPQ